MTREGHFIQLIFRTEDLPFFSAVRSAFLDFEKKDFEAERKKLGALLMFDHSPCRVAYHEPSWNARTWGGFSREELI